MIIRKGKHKYVPVNVLKEVDTIKRQHGLKKDVNAFNKMVQYSKVGRESERIYSMINPFVGPKKKKRK